MATAKVMILHACRISDTAFSHMKLLGNLSQESNIDIGGHVEDHDIVTALFHVGKPIKGGETHQCLGKSMNVNGEVMKCVPFRYRGLQVDFFEKLGKVLWVVFISI